MALYLKDASGKRVKVAGNGPSGKDATINGVATLKLAATGGITGSQSGDTYTLDGSGKQDKLTGKQGQLVGFDSTGQAVPQDASAHKHGAGDITSGVLSVARGGTGQSTLTPAVGTSALRAIHAGTADLTAGSSALTTGAIYLCYE